MIDQDQDGEGSPSQDETVDLLVPVPVLLRALASYLEVTGQDEKFANHLTQALADSGQTPQTLDRGKRPGEI